MHASPAQQDHELLPTNSSPDTDGGDHLKHGRLYRWYSGWKFTLSLASASCIFVLSFNLGFLLWAVARNSMKENRGSLYGGDCEKVRQWSTGLHLLINIFSSVLLGASNYVMQCLCAPTRRDIDRAHRQGHWLDIGVPSLGNLLHVPKKKSLMWTCLALSSLPLHIIYNSAIFSTTAAYSYTVFAGHESLGTKARADLEFDHRGGNLSHAFLRFYQEARNGSLLHLENSECLNAYLTQWQTRYSGVLLVTDDINTTNHYDLVYEQEMFHPTVNHSPHSWVCPWTEDLTCADDLPSIQSEVNGGSWNVQGLYGRYLVDSCLVEKVPGQCKLQYSLPLIMTVIVANIIKAIIMCYITVTTTELPLLTTGDAVASFLHQPDTCSLGRCLVSRQELDGSYAGGWIASDFYRPILFSARQKRWYSAVARNEWTQLILVWLLSIAISVLLLGYAASSDGAQVWDATFGSVNAQSLIHGNSWPTSLIANTIIANIPQLVFSTLYFAFNNIMTGMALAAEWSQYAMSRKGLRVSWNPKSAQRSSYFLSLPYRYAIPLMVSSAILHWLISQSLFLVAIEAYDSDWNPAHRSDLSQC